MIVEGDDGPSAAVRFSRSSMRSCVDVPLETSLQATSLSSPATGPSITDRKKDIIVTAGGKNVAPQNIENDLKSHAIVSQAMVYGDRRKFLSVLITVSEEKAKAIAAEKGVTYSDYADLVQKPAIQEAVKAAVDAINATLPSYETLKRFAVLPNDFTQESGELTPTLKVKRKFATQKYKTLLDGFYDEKVME